MRACVCVCVYVCVCVLLLVVVVVVIVHWHCSAQLSMFNMEKRYRNKIIIIIIKRMYREATVLAGLSTFYHASLHVSTFQCVRCPMCPRSDVLWSNVSTSDVDLLTVYVSIVRRFHDPIDARFIVSTDLYVYAPVRPRDDKE